MDIKKKKQGLFFICFVLHNHCEAHKETVTEQKHKLWSSERRGVPAPRPVGYQSSPYKIGSTMIRFYNVSHTIIRESGGGVAEPPMPQASLKVVFYV